MIMGALFHHCGYSCLLSVYMLKEQGHNVPGTENGTSMPTPHQVYSSYGERARAQSTSGKVNIYATKRCSSESSKCKTGHCFLF